MRKACKNFAIYTTKMRLLLDSGSFNEQYYTSCIYTHYIISNLTHFLSGYSVELHSVTIETADISISVLFDVTWKPNKRKSGQSC